MDLVVTVPKDFWFEWIKEGDAVGEPSTGTEWGYWLSKQKPPIEPGERLYVVAWGRLRGYAPVTRVVQHPETKRWVVCREGSAVACTVRQGMRFDGFRGFRKRWWNRELEEPFEQWKTEGVAKAAVYRAMRAGVFEPDAGAQIG